MNRIKRLGFFSCIFFVFLAEAPISSGAATVGVVPIQIGFGSSQLHVASTPHLVLVTNTGTKSFSITSVSTALSEFQITSGAPTLLAPGKAAYFAIVFTPDIAQQFTDTFTVTFDSGIATHTVALNGNGKNTAAASTLNLTSLTFSGQPLGTQSASQNIVITNSGTSSLKLTRVDFTGPPYNVTGFTGTTKIGPGNSFTLPVTFIPQALGSMTGSVLLTYDTLPNQAVDLTGTGVAPFKFGVSTYPVLPYATQGAPYQATMLSAGGRGAITWALQPGSSLPSGLTLSNGGLISGTVGSTVATGTYTFTVQGTDSSKPSVPATEELNLPVGAAPGANCPNISWNVAGSSNPLVPLIDLGSNLYLGAESGGLYANGANARPADHDAYGVNLADGIQALDYYGNPSPSGNYALLTLGLSITEYQSAEFLTLANADPEKNSKLILVNGAQGGATANQLSNPTNFFWNNIGSSLLLNAGVTANQVVAVWFDTVDGGPSGTFPSDMTALQSEYETIAQLVLTKFPNVKFMYMTSNNYQGYSNGIGNLDPEPYAYESGFAVKNAIQDQLNGNANLNFDPSKGSVVAPWMSWGPYFWANGLLARSDGLVWTCQDYKADGTHPSSPLGREKAAQMMLNFFKNDDTTNPWFVKPGSRRNQSSHR